MYAQRRLISIRIRAAESESSLGVLWIAKEPSFLYADSKGYDLTVSMHREIYNEHFQEAIAPGVF